MNDTYNTSHLDIDNKYDDIAQDIYDEIVVPKFGPLLVDKDPTLLAAAAMVVFIKSGTNLVAEELEAVRWHLEAGIRFVQGAL